MSIVIMKYKLLFGFLIVITFVVILFYRTPRSVANIKPATDCCKEYTEECWTCQRRKQCSLDPGNVPCPEFSPICCNNTKEERLACLTNKDLERYFQDKTADYNSTIVRPFSECCRYLTKECISCVRNISITDFCNTNSGYFGCDPDIMIVVLLSDKLGYMEFTASIWREYHSFPANHIYLFPDSPISVELRNKVQQWYGIDVNILEYTGGKDKPNLHTVFDIYSRLNYKSLLVVDVETIVLKSWLTFAQAHIDDSTDGFLSLYHSATMHNYTYDCENTVCDLCRGREVKSNSFILTRTLVDRILKNSAKLRFDYTIDNILHTLNIPIFHPQKSLSIRIGHTNQSENNCGQNEVPYRFNRCELPNWIKDGIEFYFDRCTDPNDRYIAGESIKIINEKGVFWTRPAISYSLYGKKSRYIDMALKNVARVYSIYPGWKIWIYTDGSVPNPIIQQLCEYDVRFVDVSQVKIVNRMSWRFLVASAPVTMYAVRDIDSPLLLRGKAAVDEWLASGRKFHVMRDNPNHSAFPMNGGMWGGLHDAVPSMKELLDKRFFNDNYLSDMNFLNEIIWKIAQKSVWAHDAYSLHKFGEDHPFPLKEGNMFVGQVGF